MFRIRRVYDDLVPLNRKVIGLVQESLRQRFPDMPEAERRRLPDQLRHPLRYGYHTMLFVADDPKGTLKGFAILLYFPEQRFCYLDYISAARFHTGRGFGSALYQRVREEARALEVAGLFFECRTEEAAGDVRRNRARLRFYEYFGARPIVGTRYDARLPGEKGPPHFLLFDDLDAGRPLRRSAARRIVRTLLRKRYPRYASPAAVERIVDSFADDPVRLREPRYGANKTAPPIEQRVPRDKRIALVINDQHVIHHIRERGYVEAPVRIATIKRELDKTELFETVPIRRFGERYLQAVHDVHLIRYLREMRMVLRDQKTFYPEVFPERQSTRRPRISTDHAGYYCIDTYTPLTPEVYAVARRAVDCALTAAAKVVEGSHLAYALVRPPGHHAERRVFGGYCYFNSAACAAQLLSEQGRVAMLDIDHHHGNGQEDIFARRSDVLTISLHGDPAFAYPFFSGARDERGRGQGRGYTINYPLPERLDGERYCKTLAKALREVRRYAPEFLVVPLGLDIAKGDPTGTWSLLSKDFEHIGRMIGALQLPTVVVQEGGYNNRNLGINARRFFRGLWERAFGL